METSDIPPGVINIVTGLQAEMVPTLAAHDDVDGIWYFGSAAGKRRGGASLHREHETDLGEPRAGT